MKHKNWKSELIQKNCVLEERKAKGKALANEDFVQANLHSIRENFCIIEREKAKS